MLRAPFVREPAPYDDTKSLRENKQRDRGAVRCYCGCEVDLFDALHGPDYAAECPSCGALYNLTGQALEPRANWEEPSFDD